MNYKSLADVQRVISLAKPEAVVRLFWASYQEGLQYQAWLEGKQAEYDVLWPTTEDVAVLDEEGLPVMVVDEDGNETAQTKQVPIDYSDNEAYVTFDEWMAEREVVTLTRTKTHKIRPLL
jgi:glucan phosphorylase